MNFKELINKEVNSFSDEKDGYKKYKNARFVFTKERAEEFSRVSVETLLEDKYFLGLKWENGQGLFPANKDIILDFYEQRKKRYLDTFVYTGGIGLGKTLLSVIFTYINVFDIIILPDPWQYFGLSKDSYICHISLSLNAEKAKRVTFKKKLPAFMNSPFYTDYFPPHADSTKISENPRSFPSDLRFPKNIVLFPGTGQASSALGYDIYSADLDELNDFQIVDRSKKMSSRPQYDAAEECTREIQGRIESRFHPRNLFAAGKKYGFINLIGQARYPDSFLERKIREAQALGDESSIYWVRKAVYEAQPPERFSKEKFFFDVTNRRVIDFISIDKRPDLLNIKCTQCGIELVKGSYVGNQNKLVCSLDCYRESYNSNLSVEKI
jgi:hypothetical protein